MNADPKPAELSEQLIDNVQRRLADERSEPTGAALARAVRAEASVLVSDAEMLKLIRALQRELVGAGPLAGLLADSRTTDVVVNGPDDVRVDRGSGWERVPILFSDDAAVQRLARRLANSAGQRLDEARPYVDARLSDGTRLHAVLPPVAASGTCMSLRVLRPTRHDLPALRQAGTLPGALPEVLRQVLAARLAFLVCGGTGSGKTTLLAALLAAVDVDERVVTVEDAEELRPTHPHVIRLVARSANVEGAGAIPLRQLVRQALRMRPDRIVVGEVRGPEVVDLSISHHSNSGLPYLVSVVRALMVLQPRIPVLLAFRADVCASLGELTLERFYASQVLLSAEQAALLRVRVACLDQQCDLLGARPGWSGRLDQIAQQRQEVRLQLSSFGDVTVGWTA